MVYRVLQEAMTETAAVRCGQVRGAVVPGWLAVGASLAAR